MMSRDKEDKQKILKRSCGYVEEFSVKSDAVAGHQPKSGVHTIMELLISLSMVEKDDENQNGQTGIVTQKKVQTQRPPMYRVSLLNDDYTTMEFVVYILEAVFNKSQEEANLLMLQVHKTGSGTCGVYTKEIAETKVETVLRLAKKEEFPLQCIMELA